LQQTTAFINFAQEFVNRHGAVSNDFQADDAVVDDFKRYLGQAGVNPPEKDWQHALPFLRMRIQAEMLNLVFGIARGDEAEARSDPQLRAAVDAMARAESLLVAGEAAAKTRPDQEQR
jgi:carboxyl-terminal processing protease